jgi:diguanylate cyclase (GGDEF)-like protein/PAS domain S-box-containing protein
VKTPSTSIIELTTLKSPDIFHDILDQAKDIILVVRLGDTRILYANQAAAIAYGYSRSELLTLSVQSLRAPDLRSKLQAQLQSAYYDSISFRTLHQRKNGEHFPVEVSSTKIQNVSFAAVISIVRDITATVALENALHESEQKQQCLNEELIAANEELTASNEELTAINEELTASEEDLRVQFLDLLEKEAEIRRQNSLLSSLQETTAGLIHRRNPTELLSMIVTAATRLVGTEHGFIYLLDKSRKAFRRTHGLGMYQQDIGRKIAANKGIVGMVRKTGRPAVINDYAAWRAKNPESVQFDAIVAVLQIPLKSAGQVIGTIGLTYCESGKKFGSDEVSILGRFAEMASIALDNATLIETSERENQERCIAEASLQAMINAIPDLLFVLRRDGTFIDCHAGSETFHIPRELFIGNNLTVIFSQPLATLMLQKINRAFETNITQQLEYELLEGKSTSHFEARIAVSGADQVLAICRNVTERKRMEDQLTHLSLHDALTGCYNRTFFEEEMHRWEKQRDKPVSLLMCDVDGLKIVNDSLGHGAGDEILKNVADILRHSFRPGDIISRIGGDEFVVLMTPNSIKSCENACQRIKKHIQKYNDENPTLPISLSLGYAVSRQFPVDMNSLFKEADNNMYREKLHQKNSARSAIVQGLVKALEMRDFITEGHGDRLQNLVEDFARALGLPESSMPDLRLLAHFHDIGKVGIPDSILFKPGPLTLEERSTMQKHCEIGHRIAMSTPDLAPIAGWILKHQEWWNGKGYPLGLKEDAIPLECRILSIVDAFDAMTHDRPYRKGLDPSVAAQELHRCAGTQFDPYLVDRFAKLLLPH